MQTEKCRRVMKHNEGMSFIEIIIVITILAIFAGGTVGSISYIRYADTKKCAGEINAAIEKVRMDAMSMANKPSLYVYQYNNIYYIKEIGTDIVNPLTQLDDTGTRLANNHVQLCYRTVNMAPTDSDVVIRSSPSPNVYMKLGFLRSTGGIAYIDGTTDLYTQILVKNKHGELQYTITLVQATGKHFINSN